MHARHFLATQLQHSHVYVTCQCVQFWQVIVIDNQSRGKLRNTARARAAVTFSTLLY